MTREEAASEYVLGTLNPAERRALEGERRTDAELDQQILALEQRLAPLLESVAPVAPPPGLWDRINAALDDKEEERAPLALVADAARRARFWRGAAIASWLLLAGLAGVAGWYVSRGGESYVAVVNREGTQPALIVRVDTRRGTVSIRPVAAEAPAGQSLELWYVEAPAAPRSLGVLREGARALPDVDISGRGILAVSVEPSGGSPTGQPTGPVIYTGQLIREP